MLSLVWAIHSKTDWKQKYLEAARTFVMKVQNWKITTKIMKKWDNDILLQIVSFRVFLTKQQTQEVCQEMYEPANAMQNCLLYFQQLEYSHLLFPKITFKTSLREITFTFPASQLPFPISKWKYFLSRRYCEAQFISACSHAEVLGKRVPPVSSTILSFK